MLKDTVVAATAILTCVGALAGCTGQQSVQNSSEILIVDVPRDLFVPEGHAVAYRLEGDGERRVAGIRLSLAPLLETGIERTNGFLLLTHSNGRYRAVDVRQSGDELIGNILTGRTYIILPIEWGHLRRTMDILCGIPIDQRRPPREILARFCQFAYCAREVLPADELARNLKIPTQQWNPPSSPVGGWTQGTSAYCDLCTEKPDYAAQEPGPAPGCMSWQSASQCNTGTPLLSANFESGALGSPPSLSPAGEPADDALSFAGDVNVSDSGSSGSKAVLLVRDQVETRLDGILGEGAASTGSYCMRFSGEAVENTAALEISLISTTDQVAWKLVVDGGEATLVSGSGTHFLPGSFNSGVLNDFRFDLDLDLGRFDVVIDGSPAQQGLAFLDSDFGVPARVRFRYVPAILEFFPGSFIVDDLALRKTN